MLLLRCLPPKQKNGCVWNYGINCEPPKVPFQSKDDQPMDGFNISTRASEIRGSQLPSLLLSSILSTRSKCLVDLFEGSLGCRWYGILCVPLMRKTETGGWSIRPWLILADFRVGPCIWQISRWNPLHFCQSVWHDVPKVLYFHKRGKMGPLFRHFLFCQGAPSFRILGGLSHG